jgi:hypothetical protein
MRLLRKGTSLRKPASLASLKLAQLVRLFNRQPTARPICGILTGPTRHVRLSSLIPNGARLDTAGPSTEGFIAEHCLIGSEPFSAAEPKFRCLRLSLEDYEEWLWQRSIEITKNTESITARYRRPKYRSWKIDLGRLTLETALHGPMPGLTSRVTLTELFDFQLTTTHSMNLERAVGLSTRLEDLMILLTDSKRGLDFPVLKAHRAQVMRSSTTLVWNVRLSRWNFTPVGHAFR